MCREKCGSSGTFGASSSGQWGGGERFGLPRATDGRLRRKYETTALIVYAAVRLLDNKIVEEIRRVRV